MHKMLLPGGAADREDYYIVDSSDYNYFKTNSKKEAIETQVLFNVLDWKESSDFYSALDRHLIRSNDKGLKVRGNIIGNYFYNEKNKFVKYENLTEKDYYITDYALSAKVRGKVHKNQRDFFSMLFIHIAIISFIFASTILYIKVINISWRDNEVYRNINLLGEKKKNIKKIITNQLLLVYGFTTTVGIAFGLLVTILMYYGNLFVNVFVEYSLWIGFVYLIFQLCMFLCIRNKYIKKYNYS